MFNQSGTKSEKMAATLTMSRSEMDNMRILNHGISGSQIVNPKNVPIEEQDVGNSTNNPRI